MLDALSARLQKTFRRLGSRGTISEADLDEALREVRVALLEADVNFAVVRDFIARVRERALGADVTRSITPGQQVIGIVHQQLIEMLGGDAPQGEPLLRAEQPPTTILICGLKGSGKTTLAARLALHLKGQGQRPLLVATDFERVAASEQLQALGKQIDVPVYVEEQAAPASEVGRRALAEAGRIGANAVIVDTRGAVTLDDDLRVEVSSEVNGSGVIARWFLFFSIDDARQKLEAWRLDYNTQRPHSSLNDRTPTEFARGWQLEAAEHRILNL